MKIGILTFHWGANHGAVLQAYATQKFLTEKGFQTEIIDYYPQNREIRLINLLNPSRPSVVIDNFECYLKNKRIEKFRINHLKRTRRYRSNKELIEYPPDCEILITGSDQVWNMYYLMNGEKKITPVYFLNFGKPGCRKIALSISFGCTKYPEDVQETAMPYIRQFDAISVREQSGADILANMGLRNIPVTADPTVLLDTADYLGLCDRIPPARKKTVCLCMLRKINKNSRIKIQTFKAKNKKYEFRNIKNYSVEKWLANIRDSEFVITNSFHCVMICLKLHRQFCVLPETGKTAGMNDRFYTLLSNLGLMNCIIQENEEPTFMGNSIPWNEIDKKIQRFSDTLAAYLLSSIQKGETYAKQYSR